MTRKTKSTAAADATGSTDLPSMSAAPAACITAVDNAAPVRITKSATVVALLSREEGATLAELVAATGWLPHTTRAALTGLKKKGHVIERTKRDDVTCYRIVPGA